MSSQEEASLFIFRNDEGFESLYIGVRSFGCMGVSPPFDHPHVYLDIGLEDSIVCPYCSTVYVYKEGVELGCVQKGQHATKGPQDAS